jgi:hypothetical protein
LGSNPCVDIRLVGFAQEVSSNESLDSADLSRDSPDPKLDETATTTYVVARA